MSIRAEPTRSRLLYLIRSDYRRYLAIGGPSARGWGVVLLCQGLWATSVYRVSHAVSHGRLPGPIRRPLMAVLALVRKLCEVLTGISLPPECVIDEGLYIGHFGPVIVGPHVRIGANCNLSQCVTLGKVHQGPRAGEPVLGDRVYVGPNSVLIGGITLGNDAAVGAGAVVIDSVPDGGVADGNPARAVSTRGSFDLITYDGMHADQLRARNLARFRGAAGEEGGGSAG